jgi:hypothetical protein
MEMIKGTMTFAEWFIGFRLIVGALIIVFPGFTTFFLLKKGSRPHPFGSLPTRFEKSTGCGK